MIRSLKQSDPIATIAFIPITPIIKSAFSTETMTQSCPPTQNRTLTRVEASPKASALERKGTRQASLKQSSLCLPSQLQF